MAVPGADPDAAAVEDDCPAVKGIKARRSAAVAVEKDIFGKRTRNKREYSNV